MLNIENIKAFAIGEAMIEASIVGDGLDRSGFAGAYLPIRSSNSPDRYCQIIASQSLERQGACPLGE